MSKLLVTVVLSFASLATHAATIEAVISPTSFVSVEQGVRTIVNLPGKPVYACGMAPFNAWAARIEGQTVAMGDGAPNVSIDGLPVPLDKLLVRSGWLRPAVMDDDAQAAITERRGGWACASAQAPFDAMHTSVDPKILAGVALNESAFNGRAWPWTLNVAGRGFYFQIGRA